MIELLVVMATLAVLATLLFPLLEHASRRQKEVELKQALLDIRDALDAYREASRSGVFKSGTESGYPRELAELTKVRDARGQLFLRAIPVDPFVSGQSKEVLWGIRSYQSPPGSPAALGDVFDIYSTSNDRGSNGVPYREW
ncbi:type II secretion system protein [Pseudomonas tohonis]|uniref:type II secretion system protein n=1 Tax=Pseudomonas tohonis TaxID=2725477 RepID=UPI0021D90D77|nr:type II secretion system protein [Pseudomonas tohonis]UXY50777.1 type II secretion system GspH family protein [Pseudomonas tohonis]